MSKFDRNVALSKTELRLLSGWERARKLYVTVEDLRSEVGTQSANVARRMTSKGVLLRVKRGLWVVRPLRTLLRSASPSSVFLLAVLLDGEPYYVGGLWAFTFHGLTTQSYVSVLDAFVQRHRATRVAGARVRFHVIAPERMGTGIQTTVVEGINVRVSEPARTIVDALDYPGTVGGLGRAIALVTPALETIDPKLLALHAARHARHSTCQRLGVLLERRGAARFLSPLRKRVGMKHSLTSMGPGPRRGVTNPRWNVVENDP